MWLPRRFFIGKYSISASSGIHAHITIITVLVALWTADLHDSDSSCQKDKFLVDEPRSESGVENRPIAKTQR